MPRILGIETSCDETSAAVVSGSGDAVTLDSMVILSQDVHAVFGGVVPEIASRAHLTSIVPVVAKALGDASVTLDELDGIAVTSAPGLIGALLVGGRGRGASRPKGGRPQKPWNGDTPGGSGVASSRKALTKVLRGGRGPRVRSRESERPRNLDVRT